MGEGLAELGLDLGLAVEDDRSGSGGAEVDAEGVGHGQLGGEVL